MPKKPGGLWNPVPLIIIEYCYALLPNSENRFLMILF